MYGRQCSLAVMCLLANIHKLHNCLLCLPAGTGKTTLCKALAGRVPRNHMVGDVRVLCSSAADNFKAEVELTAAGTAGSAATACNISHMTGFVPQFDQLHETLTVGD